MAALRAKLGLTQSRLAATTGLQQSEISRIERGRGNPTQETLDRLGRALGAQLGFGSAPIAATTEGGRKPASTYATGGGGTHFEQLASAGFLADLLLGRTPVPIWETWSLHEVRFQQRVEGAQLDDLVLVARRPQADQRLVEVAVRHRPKFTSSDEKFVSLIVDCLRSLRQHADEYENDQRRLAIVVDEGTPQRGAVQKLTDISRSHSNAASFIAAVDDKSNAAIRSVCRGLRGACDKAAKRVEPQTTELSDDDFWHLLRSLHIISFDIEGPTARDRNDVVNHLVAAVEQRDRSIASALFARLVTLAAESAAIGAVVDERLLRRTLAAEFQLVRSPRHAVAWDALMRLSKQVEAGIHARLPDAFHVPRSELHQGLVAALAEASPLLVTGEPGTGKSAACLEAARSAPGDVLFLTLRDLPPNMFEFESQLGGGLGEVLSGVGTRGRPLVIIDGAEAALENREHLLRDLLTAIPLGVNEWQVCLISRHEGSQKLLDLGSRLWPQMELRLYQVPGLDDNELELVAGKFPQLRHLLSQPRAKWLMRRLFYIDLVLRQDMTALLNRDLVGEADLMDAFWREAVRLGGHMGSAKGSPDGREQVMLSLGRAHLQGDPVGDLAHEEPAALTGLRADGILHEAWRGGPVDFAHDIIRDFAVARVLLRATDITAPLLQASGPRWALRACRLACQVLLSEGDDADRPVRFERLNRAFKVIAGGSGERWSEVPWEALLTVADVQKALRALWTKLLEDSGSGVAQILQVLGRRFVTRYGMADLGVWTPVLEVVLGSYRDLPEALLRELDTALGSVLETVARQAIVPDSSRPDLERGRVDVINSAVLQIARTYLLDRLDARGNEPILRGLALLGPAIDEPVTTALRNAANTRPDELEPVVEETVVARRVIDHNPDLLLHLAEAYYIDNRPRDSEWGYSPFDDGVRDHRRRGRVGFPFANWWFGPFYMLLRARPVATMKFINRLLDQAANVRLAHLADLSRPVAGDPYLGPTVRMFDFEERVYAGDDHAYRWYRGTAVGPHVCMSALLAAEVFFDELIEGGVPLPAIGRLLLNDAHNLAAVGLWVGVLVRHIDKVTDEMDALLSVPDIWELEAARVAHDQGGFRAHQQADCYGEERRLWTFTDAAGYLIINARGDRVDKLRQIGAALLAGPRGDEAVVGNWASQLDASSYTFERAEEGILIRQHPPEQVAAELQRSSEPGRQFLQLNRLMFSYGRTGGGNPQVTSEQLVLDLSLARGFLEQPPVGSEDRVVDAAAATAAIALRAHFDGTTKLSDDDVNWCSSLALELANAAPHRTSALGVIHEERWEFGWDRSAARSLALLARERPDLPGLSEGLISLGRSQYHETQEAFGSALATVWTAPCSRSGRSGRRRSPTCIHERAFAGVVEMVAGLKLGPWDNAMQRRPRQRFADPVLESIRACEGRAATFMAMEGAVSALDICAVSPACVAPKAKALLDALFDLHARGWVSWADHDNFIYAHEANPVHAIAARHVLDGDDELLERMLNTYADHPSLLAAWLDSLAAGAITNEQQQRLTALWPGLMDRIMPALNVAEGTRRGRRRHDRGRESLVEALLPVPTVGIPVQVWPDAELLTSRVLALIQWGGYRTELVNQLIRFLGWQPIDTQLGVGLDWFLMLVMGSEEHLMHRTRLGSWLRRIRDELNGPLEPSARAKWQRLVDGLAAAGDSSAIRLQQEEE